MLEDFTKGRRVEFTGGNFSSDEEDLRDDESYAQTAMNCPGGAVFSVTQKSLSRGLKPYQVTVEVLLRFLVRTCPLKTQQSLKALFLFLILFSALTYGITATVILG